MANLVKMWWDVRSPFVLPTRCHHSHDWEVFDVDKAGCRVCGRVHHCGQSGECVQFSDSDHLTCEITGCWIRNRNFQQSYTDTAMVTNPSNAQADIASRPWVEPQQVSRWLHVLLASDSAHRCLQREIKRVADKASCAFARVSKAFKLKGRPPDVLAMFAETRFVLGSLRVPARLPEGRALVELVDECTLAITAFTSAFRWVLAPFVPPVKIELFVIGMIYMLRHGLVMYDTMHIIPRIPVLRRLLPMETSLKAHFKVPCKIITETENTVKNALKRMDRRRLKALMRAAE
jgi:hypothetical protein